MKLEDLYPGNKVLVLKKVEDVDNQYVVSGKGAAVGVMDVPEAVTVGSYLNVVIDIETGKLVFEKVADPVEPAAKSTRGQGCFLGEKAQQYAVN